MADQYRVNVGIDYEDDTKRAEPGDVVDDLPEEAIGWLTDSGAISFYDPNDLANQERLDTEVPDGEPTLSGPVLDQAPPEDEPPVFIEPTAPVPAFPRPASEGI